MSRLAHEIHSALRSLRRAPAFTALAIGMLALGIGANVAIFSIFRSVVLAPLPYPRPDDLVGLSAANPAKALAMPSLSVTDFRDVRTRAQSFTQLAAFRPNFTSYQPGTGEAIQLIGALVTEEFFPLFGLPPLRGRAFTAEEFSAAAPRTAMLSHAAWRRHFGERPDILGATVRFDDQPVTIVGIMPEGFREPEFVDIWLPFPAESPEYFARDSRYWTTVGRLKPGVTLGSAHAEVTTLAQALADEYPSTNKGWTIVAHPLLEQRVGGLRAPLLLLSGAVGLVLLVACVNLANLMLARGVGRLGELAVKLALGASPGMLARAVLLESLWLALAGGTLGILLATLGLPAIAHHLPAGLIPRSHAIGVDGPALAFALAVASLTGLTFGLLPAWQVRRMNVNELLKSGGARGGTSRFTSRAQAVLVSGQIALTLMVLAGAGLLMRSLLHLQNTPVGFEPRDVVTLRVAPPESRWQDFRGLARSYEQLIDAMRRVPGVESVAFDSSAPLCGISLRYPFWVQGRPRQEGNADDAVLHSVNPDFARTLKLPLLSGRFLEDRDDFNTLKVCVINRTLAERIFPGENPIGKRIQVLPFMVRDYREIVGVLADARQENLVDPSPPQIYVPIRQSPWFFGALMIRVPRADTRLADLRAALREADPVLPVDLRLLTENIAQTTVHARLQSLLFGLFAAMALGLSSFGIYASMAFTVGQRVREIGVRQALGATPRGILRWVLARAAWLCLAGVAAGLAGALALGRLLQGLLHGVAPHDPLVLIALTLFVPAVTLLASAQPAWMAARLSPTRALQHD